MTKITAEEVANAIDPAPPSAPTGDGMPETVLGFTVLTSPLVPENEIWIPVTPDYAKRLADAVNLFNATRRQEQGNG